MKKCKGCKTPCKKVETQSGNQESVLERIAEVQELLSVNMFAMERLKTALEKLIEELPQND